MYLHLINIHSKEQKMYSTPDSVCLPHCKRPTGRLGSRAGVLSFRATKHSLAKTTVVILGLRVNKGRLLGWNYDCWWKTTTKYRHILHETIRIMYHARVELSDSVMMQLTPPTSTSNQ